MWFLQPLRATATEQPNSTFLGGPAQSPFTAKLESYATVATDESLCLEKAGPQIFFASNE